MSTKIETLELEILANSTSASKGLDALTSSLTKLKKAINGSLGLPQLSKEIGDLDKNMKKMGESNNKTMGSFTDLFHKMTTGVTVIKKVGGALKSVIKKSSDYTENVNLFNVAMGSYADEAMKYAEQVSEAMGIDTSDWIRSQGVFMTLATGFGVASDRASVMSKNLTQLGYDLASFYNLNTEDAMQKLQSGLAGELEPLRRIGYDLSQAKLEATALKLGIDKTLSSMTQAEKAQLRYYAIMTQVTETHGDMARTLDAPANQIRVFKAEINMAAREIGNVFIPALNAILPPAIALTKVVGTLASIIAGFFKKDSLEIDDPANQLAESSNTLSENMENATDEAKKLKSYMLGIDELNVLNPNSGGEESSNMFDFPLPTYDFMDSAISSRVNDIVENMKKWLGITEDITSWSDLLHTRLGRILTTVGLIGTGLSLWKLTSSFWKGLTTLKTLLRNPTYSISVGVLLTITGFKISLGGMGSAIKDGLDGFNFAEIIGGALLGTGSVALLGSIIATAIDKSFAKGKIALKLTEWGINLGVGTVGATGAALAAAVSGIILGIPTYFIGIYDAIKNGIDWLSGLLIPLGATAATTGIGTIVAMIVPSISIAAFGILGVIIGVLTTLGILIYQKWDEISAWTKKNIVRPMATFFKPLTDACTEAWIWLRENLFVPFGEAFTQVSNYALETFGGLLTGAVTAFTTIINKVVEIKNKIVEIFKVLKWAFDEYVWNPIAERVSTFYILNIKPIVDGITEATSAVWAVIKEKVFDKIANAIDDLITDFKMFGEDVVDFTAEVFKTVINAVLTSIENKVNSFIGLINGAIGIINNIPGVSITKITEISVPLLAEGAYDIPSGQMFIAREAGAEMVGSIGRKTAVANNDQIVEGIAGGVASANEEQNALLREQNSLLRSILEKDSGVYLDGKNLTNSVEKYQRERGRILVTGGVI
jgi:hypothetical protein